MADVADADAASEAALSTVAASEASSDVDGVRTPRLLDGDGADADEAAAAVVSFDFFALPTELRLRILLYLEPRELAGLVRVCKRWRSLAHTNRIWWLHCMRHFWEPGDRPKRDAVATTSMSAVDLKVNWYERYVSTVVWPARNPPAPPELPEPEPKYVEVKPSKQEMREYYKSIRSKPKNKKPQHLAREFFDM